MSEQREFNFYPGKAALSDLFQAYMDCRQHKRNTANALAFEAHYESKLIALRDDINNGHYYSSRSIAFMVKKPVMREIFAADFRDRVVHHWLINKLNPLFEKEFIHDSYACRVNKGTHFGIQRLDRFIRQCSHNYTQDAYILKCDIQSFFMTINKNILFDRLHLFIEQKYHHDDKQLILDICRRIIYLDSTRHCHVKGNRRDWDALPKGKSLFHSKQYCGLPIGNLTSQIFANFYMNLFDHFCKHDLKLRFYGRYVDDFCVVHESRDYLESLIPVFTHFLKTALALTLHPKKITLQHYHKGIPFLGVVIKPNRIYMAPRTKNNFYEMIQKQNEIENIHKPTRTEKEALLSRVNSYIGIMKHYNTYKFRYPLLLNNLAVDWWKHIEVEGWCEKIKLKKGKKK